MLKKIRNTSRGCLCGMDDMDSAVAFIVLIPFITILYCCS